MEGLVISHRSWQQLPAGRSSAPGGKTRVGAAKSFDCDEHLAKVKTNSTLRWEAKKRKRKTDWKESASAILSFFIFQCHHIISILHFISSSFWPCGQTEGQADTLDACLFPWTRGCVSAALTRNQGKLIQGFSFCFFCFF